MTDRRILLGIDTATPVSTVAVVEADLADGRTRCLAEASHRDARRHGEVLPLLVVKLLEDASLTVADLTDIAVGVGPGAYTGLRVGIATATALSSSLGVPAWGALTLDAIAFATGRTAPLTVVTDARRREVFAARYGDHRTRVSGPVVGPADEVLADLGRLPLVVTVDTPDLTDHLDGRAVELVDGPRGVGVCEVVVDRLHRAVATDDLRPVYLRRPDVTPAAGTKPVLS
jgi:tRNA threonylcarbamoyladenosine biosynthesis protein TsaB